jgi:uncharacterized protein (DUF1330 family)
MAAYLIADVTVTDDAWLPEYATHVHDIVHKHGGKYLTRTGNIRTVEGEPLESSLLAVLEFPSGDALQAFLDDPAYEPYRAARQGGSVCRFHALDDADAAGTIPYLPKGQQGNS